MRNGKICTGVTSIFLIIIAVLFFTFIVLAMNKMNNEISYNFIEELGFNWSQSPIVDLSVSKVYEAKEDNFISDSWPGTVTGCKCDKIKRKACSVEDIKKNCTDFKAIAKITYKF